MPITSGTPDSGSSKMKPDREAYYRALRDRSASTLDTLPAMISVPSIPRAESSDPEQQIKSDSPQPDPYALGNFPRGTVDDFQKFLKEQQEKDRENRLPSPQIWIDDDA